VDGVDREWEYHQDQRDQVVADGGIALLAIALATTICLAVMAAKAIYDSVYCVMVGIVGAVVFVTTTPV
jgi:hypothetical protein